MRSPFVLAAALALALPVSGLALAQPKAKPTAAPAPSPSPAPGGATGKLNREEFEEALKPYLKDMHDCYEKALKKDAVAEGQIILVIETAGGKVLKGETDMSVSTLKLDEAHKCIVPVLKKMKMPVAKNADGVHDPKAKAIIRYPVEFSLGIDVSAGVSKSTGAKLDYDKVKQVFFIEKIAVGRCYIEAYKAKKGVAASGKLLLKVGVAGGKVTSVEAMKPETTVTDAEMTTCILDAVKKFKFPMAKDAKGNDDPVAASVIVYPLEFQSK